MTLTIDSHIVFLATMDLPATAAFYEKTLGLTLALDQGKCRIYHCFLRDPNGYLVEIQRFEDPRWK